MILATKYGELPLQFPWGELPRCPRVEVTPKNLMYGPAYYTSGFL